MERHVFAAFEPLPDMCTRRCTQIFLPQNESNKISIEEKQTQHQTGIGGRKEGRKDRAYVIHLSPHCLPKVSLCPLSYTYFTRPLSTHPMALSNNQYFKYSVLERTSLAYCSLDSHQVVFETLRRKIPVFFHRVNSGFGWSVARGRGSYIFQWSELYFLRSLPWRQV